MKILMVQRFDIANVGCAERIWRQAEELTRRGHDITLVHFPHEERRRNLPRMRPDAPPGVTVVSLDRRGTSLARNRQAIACETAKADLVHLWKAYPDIALPVLHSLHSNPKPLHYDWDDLEGGDTGIAYRLTGSKLAAGLLTFWEREILKWTDTVTVASQALEELCLSEGFPPSRLFPGPVGAVDPTVTLEQCQPWKVRFEGKRLAVFLGQLEADDFPPSILAAVQQVVSHHPDFMLVLIGDGAARKSLEAEAAKLGLAEHIHFTGYLPRDNAQALLSLATLFLFPLRDDLMSRCKSPLVVVEAMAHGLPTVASSVGEAPRMLGESGVLVSGLAGEAWADAINGLLGNREKAYDLGRQARKRFEQEWTWGRSVDHLEEAYRRAMDLIPPAPFSH
jgi:glycosyltransferase involved in cell wall biosynthesis